MRLLVVTSPTGGHFYPAIEVIKKLYSYSETIIFVVQKYSKFTELIKKELSELKNIKIIEIYSEKFHRNNPLSLIKLFFSLITSTLKSVIIILKTKPHVVFSTGGYTSVPVIIATKLISPKTPVVLHEQNCILSLTTKFMSIFATKVCLGFNIKKNNKFVFTGNPLREKFMVNLDKRTILKKYNFDYDKLTLLVFGGSQGAKSINSAVINFLAKYQKILKDKIQVVHISGDIDFNRVYREYNNINVKHKILSFSTNIEEYYTIADIVVCRAGAMTITELIYFKKPAVLIPLPTAAELHQHYNAWYLMKHGCAYVVFQQNNWEEKLHNIILYLITHTNEIHLMQKNYKNISLPQISIETVIQKIYNEKYAKR